MDINVLYFCSKVSENWLGLSVVPKYKHNNVAKTYEETSCMKKNHTLDSMDHSALNVKVSFLVMYLLCRGDQTRRIRRSPRQEWQFALVANYSCRAYPHYSLVLVWDPANLLVRVLGTNRH